MLRYAGLLLLLTVGCGEGDTTPRCSEGRTRSCICDDSRLSVAVCGADGEFGACVCEGECTPGVSRACECDGGVAGVAVCTDELMFAPCDCSTSPNPTTGGGGSDESDSSEG